MSKHLITNGTPLGKSPTLFDDVDKPVKASGSKSDKQTKKKKTPPENTTPARRNLNADKEKVDRSRWWDND